jgi:hypothetical protein
MYKCFVVCGECADVTTDPTGECGAASWVENTALFQKSIHLREEIRVHKWCESEKAGHDIGWERASISWMMRHGNRMTHGTE